MKDVEGSGRGLSRHNQTPASRERKTMKIFGIAGVRTEIRTKHLPNASLDCYRSEE
jgi:hypothetical protein